MNIRKYSVYFVACSLFAAALFAATDPTPPKSIRLELTVDQLAVVKLGGLNRVTGETATH